MASSKIKGKRLSRRSFLKLVGAAGLAGSAINLAGCGRPLTADKAAGGKGWMPTQYNIPGSWPTQVRGRVPIDPQNPSITRDDQKCILCGQCTEVCERIQSVYGYYELPIKNEIICVNCGQCTHWCPSMAITEVDDTEKVLQALEDPDKVVVVQTAPSIRVGLGDEFGMPVGTNVTGKMVAALRRLSFDVVLDTNWGADLTIVEEANECVHRLKDPTVPHPLFTSCCPGWVKFMEYFYPEMLPNLSSAKSPQAMQGALIKTYYAKAKGINPEKIYSVSIMPCTAKKFECKREEHNDAGKLLGNPQIRDVDAVLTTRELARMLKKKGISLAELPEEKFDNLMGTASGAGIIFGNTGGVMEAAVRTAYYLLTGNQPPQALWKLTPVRGLNGIKEAALDIPGVGEIKVAVCHGLANARKILDQIRAGSCPWHFIEVMACPGGCISGGGQPRTSAPPADRIREKRISTLYKMDAEAPWRNSHDNPEIKMLYENYLGKPLGHLAHELLHTEYYSRADCLVPKKSSQYKLS